GHVGRTTREVLPGLAGSLEPIIMRVLQSGQPVVDCELTGTTPADSEVTHHWLASCYPVKGARGAVVGVSVALQDVTTQKRAEQDLRESEARLAGLIDSAMDAIITTDAAQRVVLFNPAAERMFGCSAAEALGGPLERFIPARFHAAHWAHVESFEQTGETARRMGALGAVSGVRA